mmetsp:Transcript_123932/g.241446  ORF Transcript_123932/g.241446 Transcript_123932/m.241446 type:complete len:465 (-) Transcript_123932:106-1500(-)
MAGPAAVHRLRCRPRPMSLRLLLLLGYGTRGAVGSNQTVDNGTTSNEVADATVYLANQASTSLRAIDAAAAAAKQEMSPSDWIFGKVLNTTAGSQNTSLVTTSTGLEAETSSSLAPTAVEAATTAFLAPTAVSKLATTSVNSSTPAYGELTSSSLVVPSTTVSTTKAINASSGVAPSENATASEGNSNITLDDSQQACSLPTPFPQTFEVDQSTWETFVDGFTLRGVDGKPLGTVRRKFGPLNSKLELSATDGKLWAVVKKDWEGNLRFSDCAGVDIAVIYKNWTLKNMTESTSKVLGGMGEELAVATQKWKAWPWPPSVALKLHDAEGQQLVSMLQERPWLRSHTSVKIVVGSFNGTNSTADAMTDPRFLALLAAAHFGVPAGHWAAAALLILGCCCLTTLIVCCQCNKNTNRVEARDLDSEHRTLIEPQEDGYDSNDDKAQCLNCCSGSKPKHHGLPMAPPQ